MTALETGRLWVRCLAGSYQRLWEWFPLTPCLAFRIDVAGLCRPLSPGCITTAEGQSCSDYSKKVIHLHIMDYSLNCNLITSLANIPFSYKTKSNSCSMFYQRANFASPISPPPFLICSDIECTAASPKRNLCFCLVFLYFQHKVCFLLRGKAEVVWMAFKLQTPRSQVQHANHSAKGLSHWPSSQCRRHSGGTVITS